MAAVPPKGLGGRIMAALESNKKPFLIYSVFYLFFIEIFSLFIRYNVDYEKRWYPLLTQFGFFLLLLSIYLWRDRLHFCYRKNLAVLLLAVYYLFGTFAIIFQIGDSIYSQIVSELLGLASVYLFIISFFKSK